MKWVFAEHSLWVFSTESAKIRAKILTTKKALKERKKGRIPAKIFSLRAKKSFGALKEQKTLFFLFYKKNFLIQLTCSTFQLLIEAYHFYFIFTFFLCRKTQFYFLGICVSLCSLTFHKWGIVAWGCVWTGGIKTDHFFAKENCNLVFCHFPEYRVQKNHKTISHYTIMMQQQKQTHSLVETISPILHYDRVSA